MISYVAQNVLFEVLVSALLQLQKSRTAGGLVLLFSTRFHTSSGLQSSDPDKGVAQACHAPGLAPPATRTTKITRPYNALVKATYRRLDRTTVVEYFCVLKSLRYLPSHVQQVYQSALGSMDQLQCCIVRNHRPPRPFALVASSSTSVLRNRSKPRQHM